MTIQPRKEPRTSKREPLTPEEFKAEVGVSRETLEQLRLYEALLREWNRAVNLVSEASLEDLWRRHMLDSAQLLPLLPPAPPGRPRVLVDLGSGAGFPGMVLSILGAGEVHLVESNQRKVQFLRELAREVRSDAHIHGLRIEEMQAFQADIVTVRALAPLPKLLEQAAPFLDGGGLGFFLKGKSVDRELTEVGKRWNMQIDRIPSRSDPGGTILQVGGLDLNGTRH